MMILDHTQRTPLYVAYVRPPGWSLLDHATWNTGRHRKPRTTPRPRITTMHVVLSLLLLGSAGLCPGQTFHLSGGYSGSDVRESGMEKWTGRAGYQFGADVLIGNRLFVKPGLHFVVRNLGYTLLDANTLTEQDYQYTANALSVPVLLGAHLLDPTQDKLFNAYLMAGPTAFIDLSTDLHNDALEVTTHGTQWYLGGGGGLGYGPVFLEAGYHMAMSNVFKGEGFSTNPKVNYTYIIAGVRLRFPGH
jgi:hypothetical protein